MAQTTLSEGPYVNSNLFSGYYLDERVTDLDSWDCDEEAREALGQLQHLWESERDLVEHYNEDELLDAWIDEVLDVLGFETLSETALPSSGGFNDRLLFESGDQRRGAVLKQKSGEGEAMYGLSSAVLEAKRWNADFTERFSEHRSYRDASHQVKYYLEKTPDTLEWGVLTDGRKWRLYGTKDYATETYYEVDLPELLESGNLEAFKYFYVFFRPGAFRTESGSTFLETVWNESETAAQELGEDLQDNVFTALQVLGEGFVETNGLRIDPADEERRDELKEQSLVLLYRLMFVLYAESRDLIHPDDPDTEQDYRDNFSIDQLRLNIHEEITAGGDFEDYSEHSTSMWSRLNDLFRLIDAGEESLGIPPYNGGLFDEDSHEFLTQHAVADRYVAEVIYRLGTTKTADGSFVLADYADLDTRHLGTIYEGLLEHQFRIAPGQYAAVAENGGQVWHPATEVSVADAVETVDAGDLYVVNDEGERKATGAYYTPDYVVAYIVEETIDPLLEDIHDDLVADGLKPSDREYFSRFWQRVLELKVLDPAMGSGHFLTKATGYLTEQVMEVVREQEIQSYDEQDLRREIAKECIYGVDLNGMAVELAKLSMWLETLAADQPLAFLDHHLKTGNSLVGSDIEEVLANGDATPEEGQLTIQQSFAQTRRRALEHVMDRFQELLSIDNESLEEIKEMEAAFEAVQDDPLYQHLLAMANVHTAEEFGLDVPGDAYERMAAALRDESWAEIEGQDWFRSAQATAEKEKFFHWELEFPVAFYDEDGERRVDGGFDAVIGNPPYVSSRNEDFYDVVGEYVDGNYDLAVYQVDLYLLFTELAVTLARTGGLWGYVEPEVWIGNVNADEVRRWFAKQETIQKIALPKSRIFDADVDCLIVLGSGGRRGTNQIKVVDLSKQSESGYREVDIPLDGTVFSVSEDVPVLNSIEEETIRLGDIATTGRGIGAYHHSQHSEQVIENKEFHSTKKEDGTYRPELKGKHVGRHTLQWEKDRWISYGEWLAEPRDPVLFEGERVLVRQILSDRIQCVFVDDDWLVDQGVYVASQFDGGYTAQYVTAILGSSTLGFYVRNRYHQETDLFPKLRIAQFRDIPIARISFDLEEEKRESSFKRILDDANAWIAGRNNDSVRSVASGFTENEPRVVLHDLLAELVGKLTKVKENSGDLNLSLLDYLGNYTEGPSLPDVGLFQPTESTILDATTEEYENLRVGHVETERDGDSVTIHATARYKPENEDEYETDQWGYTETDYHEAFTLTDLAENEAALIEAFVPVAVEEADGFAGFRDNATKTNSLIDRMKAITLPDPDDVADDLQRYLEVKERAEELDAKIEKTDRLIDEIVYDLYGLTDEEIEIVESAVADD